MVRLFFILFILIVQGLVAKPPALTPKDTRIKIHEILKAHVCHQTLSEEIMQRSFSNYLDETDPMKVYYLESEIDPWINPSKEFLQKTIQDVKKEDFSAFYAVHEVLLRAIDRRNQIEHEIAQASLPLDVDVSEFKNMTWSKTEEDLKERLLRMKSLQMTTAQRLSGEDQTIFLQKLDKRRSRRESELKGKSADERSQTSLAYVLKAISSSLDSQTAYFTPAEASEFMMQVNQKLYGIGAQLKDDLTGLVVTRLVEGGPAWNEKKLYVGDKVIAVNKEAIIGMDIAEAVELIRGRKGTTVNLTVLRTSGDPAREEQFEVEITRGEVILKETRLETTLYPFGDGTIGILHLFSFYQDQNSSSSSDLIEAIKTLKQDHNLKGVILDLRDNGGGLLSQAVEVTGLFISKGVVVSVKDNTGNIQHLRNLSDRQVWNGPLLILTNRASASASEIVAQTLQEYGRALVVGDPETFGKGTFQTFTLESTNYGKVNPKGEFKVTRGCYYTVSGKTPQLKGVKADIVVPGIYSELELGERYSKFPLNPDGIQSCFEDDLLDVSSAHQVHIRHLYTQGKQTISNTYTPYIEMLQKNSQQRISLNKNYQVFLEELAKKETQKSFESFGQNDLQLTETVHIMTDILFISSVLHSNSGSLQ